MEIFNDEMKRKGKNQIVGICMCEFPKRPFDREENNLEGEIKFFIFTFFEISIKFINKKMIAAKTRYEEITRTLELFAPANIQNKHT